MRSIEKPGPPPEDLTFHDTLRISDITEAVTMSIRATKYKGNVLTRRTGTITGIASS
jgi:hypothetical protein